MKPIKHNNNQNQEQMKKLILTSLFLAFLTSCSSPLNKKYSDENLEQDATEIKESGKLEDGDAELLAGWIMKSKLQGTSLEDKTYKEILDEAKKFKNEQEELALKAKKEAEEKKKIMQESVVISIYDKGFEQADYESYNSFNYVIKNNSKKDIKAFKFSFNIYDALGDEIGDGYSVSSTDETVKSGDEYKTTIYFDFNQFIDEDIELKNSKFSDLVIDVRPEKIVYTDGSILE